MEDSSAPLSTTAATFLMSQSQRRSSRASLGSNSAVSRKSAFKSPGNFDNDNELEACPPGLFRPRDFLNRFDSIDIEVYEAKIESTQCLLSFNEELAGVWCLIGDINPLPRLLPYNSASKFNETPEAIAVYKDVLMATAVSRMIDGSAAIKVYNYVTRAFGRSNASENSVLMPLVRLFDCRNAERSVLMQLLASIQNDPYFVPGCFGSNEVFSKRIRSFVDYIHTKSTELTDELTELESKVNDLNLRPKECVWSSFVIEQFNKMNEDLTVEEIEVHAEIRAAANTLGKIQHEGVSSSCSPVINYHASLQLLLFVLFQYEIPDASLDEKKPINLIAPLSSTSRFIIDCYCRTFCISPFFFKLIYLQILLFNLSIHPVYLDEVYSLFLDLYERPSELWTKKEKVLLNSLNKRAMDLISVCISRYTSLFASTHNLDGSLELILAIYSILAIRQPNAKSIMYLITDAHHRAYKLITGEQSIDHLPKTLGRLQKLINLDGSRFHSVFWAVLGIELRPISALSYSNAILTEIEEVLPELCKKQSSTLAPVPITQKKRSSEKSSAQEPSRSELLRLWSLFASIRSFFKQAHEMNEAVPADPISRFAEPLALAWLTRTISSPLSEASKLVDAKIARSSETIRYSNNLWSFISAMHHITCEFESIPSIPSNCLAFCDWLSNQSLQFVNTVAAAAPLPPRNSSTKIPWPMYTKKDGSYTVSMPDSLLTVICDIDILICFLPKLWLRVLKPHRTVLQDISRTTLPNNVLREIQSCIDDKSLRFSDHLPSLVQCQAQYQAIIDHRENLVALIAQAFIPFFTFQLKALTKKDPSNHMDGDEAEGCLESLLNFLDTILGYCLDLIYEHQVHIIGFAIFSVVCQCIEERLLSKKGVTLESASRLFHAHYWIKETILEDFLVDDSAIAIDKNCDRLVSLLALLNAPTDRLVTVSETLPPQLNNPSEEVRKTTNPFISRDLLLKIITMRKDPAALAHAKKHKTSFFSKIF